MTVRKTRAGTETGGFSAEEWRAMAARAREAKGDGAGAALAAIVAMPDADRALAERLHALIASVAPGLVAKTWYGMPAYARDDNIVCFSRARRNSGRGM